MADRTAQPPSGTGLNPIYSASARALWSAIEPNKELISGASSTTGLRGTTVAGGADGQYQLFDNTTGDMQFAATLPTGSYTLALGLVFPQNGRPYTTIFSIGTSGGFRVEVQTGGSPQVRIKITHTAVAASANEFVYDFGAYNSEMWTYVVRYDATTPGGGTGTLTQYLLRGDGTLATTTSETMGYAAPGGGVVRFGSPAGAATEGVQAAMLLGADVGSTEALALRDNIWRAFAPVATTDTTPPTITVPGNTAGSATAAVSVAENTTTVGTLAANETVTWSLPAAAAADQGKFTINPTTGALAFIAAPDFEAPGSAAGTNTYLVKPRATDAASNPTDVTITVNVTNVADTAAVLATSATRLGAWVGSGAGLTFAYDVGVNYRAEVYADGTTLGNALLSVAPAATLAGGLYPANISSLSLTAGTAYKVVFTNQATGESSAPVRMVAA